MEELRNKYKILVGKLKARDSLAQLCVNGTIILKWIYRNLEGGED
jgi:hypothetical protein